MVVSRSSLCLQLSRLTVGHQLVVSPLSVHYHWVVSQLSVDQLSRLTSRSSIGCQPGVSTLSQAYQPVACRPGQQHGCRSSIGCQPVISAISLGCQPVVGRPGQQIDRRSSMRCLPVVSRSSPDCLQVVSRSSSCCQPFGSRSLLGYHLPGLSPVDGQQVVSQSLRIVSRSSVDHSGFQEMSLRCHLRNQQNIAF